MSTVVLKIEGMSCEHCVRAVSNAINELDGISGVNVDLKSNTATVEYDPALANIDQMKAQIEDQGYDVVD